MFVANTGQMAINFNEEGINSSGSLTKSLRRPSEMTAKRQRAEATIVGISKKANEPLGITIAKVLSQSIPELQSFVQARGEAPSPNPTKLAIQAALLRATEIGVVSKSIDTDDEDALKLIEDSEQQHVEDNTGENSSILSPDTAAALSLLVYRIANRLKRNIGTGAMSDFVVAMKKAAGADNFDGVSCCYIADCFTGKVNSATGGGMIFYTPEQEQAVTGGVTQTDPDSGGGSFWDNLFGNIDNIVDGITKVTSAVNTTVGNVKNTSGGILDQINNIGGGIGAASIDQYLKENWLKIVGVIIALIIITIIIARVAKRN